MVFLLLPLMKQHQAYNFYVTQTKIPSLSYISIDIYFEMEAPFVRRNKELMQEKDTIRHAYLKCKEVNSLMRMEDIRIKCSAVWCKVILFWYACATMTVSPCASAGLRSVVVLILLRGHVLCQIKCSDFFSRWMPDLVPKLCSWVNRLWMPEYTPQARTSHSVLVLDLHCSFVSNFN